MANDYPFVNFHFKVTFLGVGAVSGDFNSRWQSIDGLKMSMTPEMYSEGGENRFKHHLLTRPTYGPLVMKRGLFSNVELYLWFEAAFKASVVVPTNLIISLLDEEHQPVTNWSVINAIPTSLEVSSLDAMKSEAVIETMTMNYQYFIKI